MNYTQNYQQGNHAQARYPQQQQQQHSGYSGQQQQTTQQFQQQAYSGPQSQQQQQQPYQQQQPQYNQGYPQQQTYQGQMPPQPGYPSQQPSFQQPLQPGMPPPPQTFQQPLKPSPGPGFSYQQYVPGLHGWNDPPKTVFTKTQAQVLALKGIDNPTSFVVSQVTTTMGKVKAAFEAQPGQKRMIEDTEKRMDFLLERLASKQVPENLECELVVIFRALQQKDFNTAMNSVTQLMTSTIDQDTRWMVGMKRLIECAVRLG